MGLKTEIRLDFGGERRSFNLSPIACIKRLQDACDAGPAHVLARLSDGTWRIEDLREPIIQGLTGAGMRQSDAQALVERYVDPEPKQQFIPVAQAVVLAWLTGAEDEDLGEPQGGAAETPPSPAES